LSVRERINTAIRNSAIIAAPQANCAAIETTQNAASHAIKAQARLAGGGSLWTRAAINMRNVPGSSDANVPMSPASVSRKSDSGQGIPPAHDAARLQKQTTRWPPRVEITPSCDYSRSHFTFAAFAPPSGIRFKSR
jgi:hypothetical protein